jgi:nitrogen fixation/metabolism regulation signal transduction histidine kinase
MVYKNFRLVVFFRLVLLAATIYLFFYTLQLQYFVTPFLITLLVILQLYLLYRYVDKTNRDLASFLESIRFSEFTRTFHVEGMGASFDELNKAFNDVIKDFQKVRTEREEQYHYLQSLVKNIDVSILTFRKDGTVDMANKTFRKLFQIQTLTRVQDLNALSPELVDALMRFTPGKSCLVKVPMDDDILQLAISGTEFRIHNQSIMLVTIKDIQNVLEAQETETWQKLIRVLTHEIMNSITPIASLTSTLELMMRETTQKEEPMAPDDVKEVQMALQTIHKRSTGLLHFVNTYRNLTKIPKPNLRAAIVSDVIEDIMPLLEKDIKKNKVQLVTNIEPNLEFYADTKLIEQVLINLIQNAIHALEEKEDGCIEVKGFHNKRGRVTIQVSDNGQGILPEVLDKIFIPFFTTKPKGSGIGLSLSKQIMRLHGGAIMARSTPEEGTSFTLTF